MEALPEQVSEIVPRWATLTVPEWGRYIMEDRAEYSTRTWRGAIGLKPEYTFIVTTPTNDRLHIKAAYCELDGGCLIFQDDNRETVQALAAGHWVKVERAENDQDTRNPN